MSDLSPTLKSSFKRKFDKTNFISQKKTPPKSPCLLGLKEDKLNHCLFKAVYLCNYADNCSVFYNAFKPFMARCTQTDFLPSNYAFGIIKFIYSEEATFGKVKIF